MFWWLVLFTGLLLYWLHNRVYTYWKRLDVPGPEPAFIVGNVWDSLTMKKSFHDIVNDIYKKYRNYPAVGIYRVSTPCLIAIDPDFVKEIKVGSFKHFQDNEFHVDKKHDPIFGRNPFVLHGEEWKKTRSIVTPSFTSGKMRAIFPVLENTAKRMVAFVDKQISARNMPWDAKQLCVKFTLDNVACCAFGLEGNCFEDEPSDFQDLANKFMVAGSWENVKIFLVNIFPVLGTFLPTKLVTKEVENRLRELVRSTLDYREANQIERPDYLQSMNQLRLSRPDFTYEDVTGQVCTFLLDGYETSAVIMSFLLYNLAANADVQEKLRDEIRAKLDDNNGVLTYEMVAEMEYLEACFIESQRKDVGIGSLGKVCTQDFTYTPTDPQFERIPIRVEKGTTVILPIAAHAGDPAYFDEPERFVPERQLKENLGDESRRVFKPFGDGPRACLGRRFGSLQVKMGIIHLLTHFRIKVDQRTKLPLKLDPLSFLAAPIGGLWINFERL